MSPAVAWAVRAAGWLATPLFALYNGVLGVWYSSLWHGSICAYYLLLSLLRSVLLTAETRRQSGRLSKDRERAVTTATSWLLFLLNAALIAPATLMVLDQRGVRMGMIPAITTATYTTYKIAAACVKLKRAKASPCARQLARLRFVDALVSILVLQNTLITAVEGAVTDKMLLLTAITTAAILLVILALSILWLVWDTGKRRREKFTP